MSRSIRKVLNWVIVLFIFLYIIIPAYLLYSDHFSKISVERILQGITAFGVIAAVYQVAITRKATENQTKQLEEQIMQFRVQNVMKLVEEFENTNFPKVLEIAEEMVRNKITQDSTTRVDKRKMMEIKLFWQKLAVIYKRELADRELMQQFFYSSLVNLSDQLLPQFVLMEIDSNKKRQKEYAFGDSALWGMKYLLEEWDPDLLVIFSAKARVIKEKSEKIHTNKV